MKLSDFHTHSVYCDGKNTLEEMIKAAIEKNFSAIGLSGHSYVDFDSSYCIKKEKIAEYKKEAYALKTKYKNEINVYCGIEEDYFSVPESGFEYKIGSVHHLYVNGEYIAIDNTADILRAAVDKHYGGDFYGLTEAYYGNVADVYRKTGCDIIGHFDLVTKFNEKEHFFDEQDARYKSAWKKALDELLKYDVVFEVNTGAIARGYKTKPYPSEEILYYIKKGGGRVIVTTDCHNKDMLGYYAEEAHYMLKNMKFAAADFEEVLKNKNKI